MRARDGLHLPFGWTGAATVADHDDASTAAIGFYVSLNATAAEHWCWVRANPPGIASAVALRNADHIRTRPAADSGGHPDLDAMAAKVPGAPARRNRGFFATSDIAKRAIRRVEQRGSPAFGLARAFWLMQAYTAAEVA